MTTLSDHPLLRRHRTGRFPPEPYRPQWQGDCRMRCGGRKAVNQGVWGQSPRERRRKPPRRGPKTAGQEHCPAPRVLHCPTEPQHSEGEGSGPPHGQPSDDDIPFAERWPQATAAPAQGRRSAGQTPPLTSNDALARQAIQRRRAKPAAATSGQHESRVVWQRVRAAGAALSGRKRHGGPCDRLGRIGRENDSGGTFRAPAPDFLLIWVRWPGRLDRPLRQRRAARALIPIPRALCRRRESSDGSPVTASSLWACTAGLGRAIGRPALRERRRRCDDTGWHGKPPPCCC